MNVCYNKNVFDKLFTRRDCGLLQELSMPINRKKIRRVISIHGAQVWITANTEQEYADKIIKLAGGDNRQQEGNQYTFKEYAERWFEIYAKPNVENVTALCYRDQLNKVFPQIGDKRLAAIEPADIQKIYNEMGEKSKETKNKVKTVLNQVFKLAVDEGYIKYNPLNSSSIKIKGKASKETQPYTVEQMRYLVAALPKIKDKDARVWLALSTSLPLRPEEVLGLKWKDVNLTNMQVNIRGTVTHPDRNKPEYKPYTKTASSVRTLAISPKIAEMLGNSGDDEDFLVGGQSPLSYTTLRNMLRRLQKEIGFDDKLTPRRFRTTVATDISAETKDLKLVQKMLGHSTPEMTLKHYDKGRHSAEDAVSVIEKCYQID